MSTVRFAALLGLLAVAAAWPARAEEENLWPAYVAEKDVDGQTQSWDAAGPLVFSEATPAPEAGTAEGFRPFYVRVTGGGIVRTDILYPLFFIRKYPDSYKWSILQLINGEGIDHSVARAGGPTDKHFDIWPFYFSHYTKDPIDSYHALLPLYGTIKYRLGFSKLQWVLFPLYVETRKRHSTTNYYPFPFIRNHHGSENGFGVWPLFDVYTGPEHSKHQSYLWPLIWNNRLEPTDVAPPGAPGGTEFGILPFYTRTTAPGFLDVNFGGPFFGFTERTLPYRYGEQRYFWPFFVQGRGDQHYVNRWGPFYTHSNVKGTDSTWVGWPFWHVTKFADDDTAQRKTQLFYFLYWELDESSVSRPQLAHAYKRHLWPLYSAWDNGAGSRQLQFPSPLEVFFPSNPDIRENWGPLFSLYRSDHRPTGETRSEVLWRAVTWRRDADETLAEFHIGPLFGMIRNPGGLRWTILGFDFGAKVNKDNGANRQP
jgi:hypothetical protein